MCSPLAIVLIDGTSGGRMLTRLLRSRVPFPPRFRGSPECPAFDLRPCSRVGPQAPRSPISSE
eukprot:1580380-Prymnesium_polylepis.1